MKKYSSKIEGKIQKAIIQKDIDSIILLKKIYNRFVLNGESEHDLEEIIKKEIKNSKDFGKIKLLEEILA